jgi:hypothetical protein
LHTVRPDRLGDVLDLLFAKILEGERQLVANLIPRRAREAYRARLGKALQPCRNVDPVTEQIVAVDRVAL